MMKMMLGNMKHGSLLLCGLFFMSSCIDEDLSGCPPFSKDIVLSYQLEIAQDVELGFSSDITSLHLGFWNTPVSLTSETFLKENDIPDDLLFSVTLPVDNYSHIAIANDDGKEGNYTAFGSSLENVVLEGNYLGSDTVSVSDRPVYSGSLSMNMEMNYENERYNVILSTVSSKYIIKVNHPSTLKDIKCYIKGIKQGYYSWNRLWVYSEKLVADATEYVESSEANDFTEYCFYTFPTYGIPSKAGEMQDGWWKLYFYSKLGDKIVQHIFTVKEPVMAGNVFEGTFSITEQSGEAVDVSAGVEIDTDWEPGNDFNIEM